MNKITGNPLSIFKRIRQDISDSELRGLLFFATIILATGTIFYMVVEGWNVLESFYFCVSVLTTVGFGDLHPTNGLSQLFTTLYMILGIGFVLGFINVAAHHAIAHIGNRAFHDPREEKGQTKGKN